MCQSLANILRWFYVLLLLVAVSATAYNTFVLQTFAIYGVYVEFYDNNSYVEFYYDGEDYELELETQDTEAIIAAIADTVSVTPEQLDEHTIAAALDAIEEGWGEAESSE